MSARSFLLACALLAGCGGKTTGDDTTTTTDTGVTRDAPADVTPPPDGASVDYCGELEARDARCMTGAFDRAQCEEQLTCFRSALRPEAVPPLLACIARRPCGTSDDRCVNEQAETYIGDAVVGDFVKSCIEKRNSCTGAFSDDYCGYQFGLFSDGLRAKLKSCLSTSCGEVRTCFDTVFAALGCR